MHTGQGFHTIQRTAASAPWRAPRRSWTATITALLAFAILAGLALVLAGERHALADPLHGGAAKDAGSPAVLHEPTDLVTHAVDLPKIPADAEDAKPLATF